MDNLSFYPTLSDDLLEKSGFVCGKVQFTRDYTG